MLRMVLVGLLIPLGIGVLVAMELGTPANNEVVAVQPLAETTAGVSDSHVALAKADRLEIAVASSEPPAQPAPVDERISQSEEKRIPPSEGVSVGSSEPPRLINRHRHEPQSKKVATVPKSKKVAALVRPQSKPKTTAIKQAAIPERRKVASDTQPCRLSAFGGLRKALNSLDCEI